MKRRPVPALSTSARVLGMLHGAPVPEVAAVDARPEAGEWRLPPGTEFGDATRARLMPGHPFLAFKSGEAEEDPDQ